MANRIKKKSAPPASPDKLNPDKQAEVTMKELVKDERTYKIGGACSLLLSLFLGVAFTSYLFTWQADQSQIFSSGGISIFTHDEARVLNLLGVLGAYTSHFFIYKGFGLASFFFCLLFFVTGINLLTGRKVFSLRRNVKYVVAGLMVMSVTLAFVFTGNSFSWGGAVGEFISEWMVKVIGAFGTAVVIMVAFFSYFIWRFNPTFKWPGRKPAIVAAQVPMPMEDDVMLSQTPREVNDLYKNEGGEAILYIEKDEPISKNKLKKDGSGVVVIMPKEEKRPIEPTFTINEREHEKEEAVPFETTMPVNVSAVVMQPTVLPGHNGYSADADDDDLLNELPTYALHNKKPTPAAQNNMPLDDMELEIKPTPERNSEEEEEDDFIPKPKAVKQAPYEPKLDLRDYKYPTLELLETHGSEKIVHDPVELETNKNQIISTLSNYDITIQRIAATVGPTVTLYEIVPAPGIRISRIKNLEDDIALSLAALGIRIIAPIPGKGTIGIEVPNVRKSIVSMKTLLASDKFQHNSYSLPIAIGKKIDNENFIVDLATMPHLLMAGATGQGKSVGLNAILVSLLYKKHPSQLKLVLVDPKKVELSIYRVIEKHFLAKLPGEEEAIITDTKKVVHTLNALCIEMDNRYDLLKEAGCRNIKEYNEKFIARKLNPEKGHQFLPFIVLVVDEFADLIMTAGKEVEMPIARLAQLARAIGIHLIIATQRPSVNIITGTIKANFPARIAFKVSSKIDSRTILDAGGAEQLIGKGDMLISYNGEITRLQCAFVDTPEVDSVTGFIGEQRGYPDAFLLPEYVDEKELESKDFDSTNRDPLFEDAARLIVTSQIGSTSLIQRRMKLGYNRAGRLMDQLEAAGVVGPSQGSKARDVQIKSEMELDEILQAFS